MYTSIDELPASIRESLSEDAQELYRAEYNRAWENLAPGDLQKGRVSCIAKAHGAARIAVQEKFEQDENGRWHKHPIGDYMTEDRIES